MNQEQNYYMRMFLITQKSIEHNSLLIVLYDFIVIEMPKTSRLIILKSFSCVGK